MYKNLILLFTALIISQISFTQTAIAKLKFEEAEEAFINKDYTTVLAKLDEAEEILGKTNPPMLYLRILSQDNIITIDPLKDFKILESKTINKKPPSLVLLVRIGNNDAIPQLVSL